MDESRKRGGTRPGTGRPASEPTAVVRQVERLVAEGHGHKSIAAWLESGKGRRRHGAGALTGLTSPEHILVVALGRGSKRLLQKQRTGAR